MPGDVQQVAGAHAGGEERLVGVAEGRVGDGDVVRLAQGPRERGRPVGDEPVAGAGRQRGVAVAGGAWCAGGPAS